MDKIYCGFLIILFLRIAKSMPITSSTEKDGSGIKFGSEGMLVQTKYGNIRGIKQKYENHNVDVFLGIPFAQSPVGNLRFQRPQPLPEPAWRGEFLANKHTSTCMLTVDVMFPNFPGSEMWNPHPGNSISEDCLAINLYVPEEHDGNVLVWIYGGGFFSGSPSLDLYDGRVLSTKQKSIVVNINYRLGVFGFLYFGADTSVSGQNGLLDQQMPFCLTTNIFYLFEGNREKVTLFGESAGGASATAHLFAPGSHKYFNKVISQSGAITNSWATKQPGFIREMSVRLAAKLNCTEGKNVTQLDEIIENLDYVLKCLSYIHPTVIQNESDKVTYELNVPMTFAFVPVEEDPHFFKGNVMQKFANNDFKKNVSLMFGSMKDEGTYWLPYFLYEQKYGFKFNHTVSSDDIANQALLNTDQYKNSIDAFMPFFDNSPLVKHAFSNAYEHVSSSSNIQEKHRDGVARFVGDLFFTCSLIEFADKMADNVYGSVYMYYFTKRPTSNAWPKYMGAMHGYEIEYVFGMPFRRPEQYKAEYLLQEQAFSRTVMDYWGSFADKGATSEKWPKYNKISRNALILDDSIYQKDQAPSIKNDVHGYYCKLIDEAKVLTSTSDPAEFEGIDELIVSVKKIWSPDTTLYNSLVMDESGSRRLLHAKLKTNIAKRTTTVEILYPTIYKFACNLDLRYFPYDKQYCKLTLGSWIYDNTKIDYFHADNETEREAIGTKHCLPNEGWDILGTAVQRKEMKYSCCVNEYTLLEYSILIQRKPLYYIVNLVAPTGIITLISIIGFFSSSTLNEIREEKISLGITTLLSMSIMIFMVSDQMPSTSSFIPLIAWFYDSMMCLISISILCSSFVIYVQKKGTIGTRPKHHLMRLSVIIGRILWLEIPLIMKQAYAEKAKLDKLRRKQQQGRKQSVWNKWQTITKELKKDKIANTLGMEASPMANLLQKSRSGNGILPSNFRYLPKHLRMKHATNAMARKATTMSMDLILNLPGTGIGDDSDSSRIINNNACSSPIVNNGPFIDDDFEDPCNPKLSVGDHGFDFTANLGARIDSDNHIKFLNNQTSSYNDFCLDDEKKRISFGNTESDSLSQLMSGNDIDKDTLYSPSSQRNLAEIEYDWLAAVVERCFLIIFLCLFFLLGIGINAIGVVQWSQAHSDLTLLEQR
uniref:Acetylcholinesterase n=1 Tax=Rhabditophanes sp. KR3021 TaxID=114890 RepID=A0AC35TS69_9BILA